MPYDQSRMIALVEESEHNLRQIEAFIIEANYQAGRLDIEADAKIRAILGPAIDMLRGARKTYTLLERERIKYTRRKNAYSREYMRRKRAGLAQKEIPACLAESPAAPTQEQIDIWLAEEAAPEATLRQSERQESAAQEDAALEGSPLWKSIVGG